MIGDALEWLCTRRPGLWMMLGIATANGAICLMACLLGWAEVLAWYEQWGMNIGCVGLGFALGYTARRLLRERRHRHRRKTHGLITGPMSEEPRFV